MYLAVEGALAWVLSVAVVLPLTLWWLSRARRALDERDARIDKLIASAGKHK
jgi:hypothetical protein